MFEGKERRLELIEELKAESRQSESTMEEALIPFQQSPNLYAQHIVEGFIAATIGGALDFLSKELIRTREQQRIASFAATAESLRKQREDAELHRREVEEKLRQKENEQFSQIMHTHQLSANSFIEDILLQSLNSSNPLELFIFMLIECLVAASQQKIQEEKMREEELRRASEPTPPQQVITDLVFGYLFPLAEKQLLQQKGNNSCCLYRSSTNNSQIHKRIKSTEKLQQMHSIVSTSRLVSAQYYYFVQLVHHHGK